MSRLLKFVRLPFERKLLLVKSGLLLASIRIALVFIPVLPFRTLHRTLQWLAQPYRAGRNTTDGDVANIVWALQAIGRRVPVVGSCLTQALAGYVLMGRTGYMTNLKIGATRDANGKFLAHAWLEKEDRIVIGELGSDFERYAPLT